MPLNTTKEEKKCAGLLLPLIDESGWNRGIRGFLYFVALLYAFIGVSVVTDMFMGAVVTITSRTKKVYLAEPKTKKKKSSATYEENTSEDNFEPDFFEVRIWNDTVANLTLLALGTSAPEILLACVEVVGHNFEAGELGPGTIVGSGAFNLLIITAVCIMSVPKGQRRRIRMFKVFLLCSAFNVFAYIWLWVVLSCISPHVVELWEAMVTLFMFPCLVFFAYATDKEWLRLKPIKIRLKSQVELERYHPAESSKMILERRFFRNGKINRENLLAFVRELKKYPGLTDEDTAILAASKILDSQPQTPGHYKIRALRNLTGSRKDRPQLTDKLQEVYKTINRHPSSVRLGSVPTISPLTHAVVEFQAATCAVRENIGSFNVLVWRHGNLNPVATVRVESVDGSAVAGEDYVKIDEIVTFESGETEKQIRIQIMDDRKWEPDEEFFLKISLYNRQRTEQDLLNRGDQELVQLGRISIMEITILDNDKPGVISFEKRGVLVRENAEAAILKVQRQFGADGEVSVRWRTIDKTAKSGVDFVGGEGVLIFRHREVVKEIEIPIIDDFRPEKDERFLVELFNPSNNATLGQINKTLVTITNDDSFINAIDKMMQMTADNLDSLSICRRDWTAQIKDAMSVNGGDLKNAERADYILHFLSFNWKVFFSFIPPPKLWGGWLCFFFSLTVIGLITVLIADIASIFGCVVGLNDSTTAITFVAMGTSLPDIFASRSAALKERHADTSIGNINGSNSVNVFLGLGLPWLIASSYHMSKGTVFKVPAHTLNFSVLLFCIIAVLAIGLLIGRRFIPSAGKAELGGPQVSKFASGTFLLFLWVAYISMACLQDYNVIKWEL